MTQETVKNGTEALFTREGMPPVKEMIPCALQHVLASFAGIITPAVIMAGVYGFNSQQSTDIIQVALILSAIDTALQAFAPFRRIGGGLPIVMGVSFAFLPALQAMGASGFSFGALLGGEIVGEESYTLPTAGERKLIRIRKTAPTPQKYPRRSDKIKKQPLG